jgi:hypothetical protein
VKDKNIWHSCFLGSIDQCVKLWEIVLEKQYFKRFDSQVDPIKVKKTLYNLLKKEYLSCLQEHYCSVNNCDKTSVVYVHSILAKNTKQTVVSEFGALLKKGQIKSKATKGSIVEYLLKVYEEDYPVFMRLFKTAKLKRS